MMVETEIKQLKLAVAGAFAEISFLEAKIEGLELAHKGLWWTITGLAAVLFIVALI